MFLPLKTVRPLTHVTSSVSAEEAGSMDVDISNGGVLLALWLTSNVQCIQFHNIIASLIAQSIERSRISAHPTILTEQMSYLFPVQIK